MIDDLLLSKRGPVVSDPAVAMKMVPVLTCVTNVELSIVNKPHYTREQ